MAKPCHNCHCYGYGYGCPGKPKREVQFVDLWDNCVCRPATYKVPNEFGGWDFIHACTCPTEVSI